VVSRGTRALPGFSSTCIRIQLLDLFLLLLGSRVQLLGLLVCGLASAGGETRPSSSLSPIGFLLTGSPIKSKPITSKHYGLRLDKLDVYKRMQKNARMQRREAHGCYGSTRFRGEAQVYSDGSPAGNAYRHRFESTPMMICFRYKYCFWPACQLHPI
jgi:hypothetical protein